MSNVTPRRKPTLFGIQSPSWVCKLRRHLLSHTFYSHDEFMSSAELIKYFTIMSVRRAFGRPFYSEPYYAPAVVADIGTQGEWRQISFRRMAAVVFIVSRQAAIGRFLPVAKARNRPEAVVTQLPNQG